MNLRRKYKTRLKYDLAECLESYIGKLLERSSPEGDDDKLLLATLGRIRDRLYQKLGVFRPEYEMSFDPNEAIALRMLYTHYITDPMSYLGNKMHTIANEVHKQFSV